MELTALAMLNPLGAIIAPFTTPQLMPFKLQRKSTPTLLSEVKVLKCYAIALSMLGIAHQQCNTDMCMRMLHVSHAKYITLLKGDLGYPVHLDTLRVKSATPPAAAKVKKDKKDKKQKKDKKEKGVKVQSPFPMLRH